MKQIQLKPIPRPFKEFDIIEKKIKKLFKDEVYLPVLKELGLGEKKRLILKNSSDDLLEAIRSGQITFYRGHFRGRFSSAISRDLERIGAEWDKKQGSFAIPFSKLHPEFKTAIEMSIDRFQRTADRVNKKIEKLVPEEIAEKIKLEKFFDSTLYRTNQEFKKSLEGLIVPSKITDEGREKLAKDYSNNMRLTIKGWLEDEIKELRKTVEKSSVQGYRYETLIKKIKTRYGVGQSKAAFLARQETNLIVSKFKEIRYKDAGINQYKWRCVVGSPNHPVRPRHKELNDASLKGTLFSFDSPPITTEEGEPLRRNNPGEDYNCRCTAVPIVKF